jgi:sulfonate transport system substrate-binding protein
MTVIPSRWILLRRCLAVFFSSLLLGTGMAVSARAETPPAVIRFGGPGSSQQNQKMWGLLEVARAKGFLAQEFQADHTELQYIGFMTVPMVGEALASNSVDFAGQGELIALLARGSGTDTRMILPISRLENAYLVVPVNSPIHSLSDIRGKRIAYMRGAYIHIQTLRILSDHGLTERDIRPVNLDPASAATVLASGGIDGTFVGTYIALPMRDRNIGTILYDTHAAPQETAQTSLITRQSFIEQYPHTTQRVVSALVRAARWASDPAHRDELISLWVYGTDRSLAEAREDLGDGPLLRHTSPLIDEFVVSQYRNTQEHALAAGLLRKPVDIDAWIDRRFLDEALREERLTGFWPATDARGQLAGVPATARAAP